MVRAARLHRYGEPLRIEEVDLPVPGEGEVRVELAFAGVNPVDSYMAQGRVGAEGPLPRTLGNEASGAVDGRPVLVAGGGLGAARDGVWATAAVVPATAVVPLPEGVSVREAAAMGVVGLTAWHTVGLAGVAPDDRVLVLGAGGGVGSTIVSLASSLGATVWGQTTSPQKADFIRGQGADAVVVTDAAGMPDAVADLRPTVAMDGLGGAFTATALAALEPGGRLVLYGTSAGATATMDLQALYRKGVRLLGYAGLRLSDDERRAGLSEALRAVRDGRMRIPVDRVLPLDEVNRALELLSGRSVAGKIVVELS